MLCEVEPKRIVEAAELVEPRQEAKRHEHDLVDAHQVVEARGRCCCYTERHPMFLHGHPAEESGDIQISDMRSLFYRGETGQRNGDCSENVRKSIEVSIAVPKKGTFFFFF